MSVLLSVGPQCTLVASHAASWWVTLSMPTGRSDRQTDGQQTLHYAFCYGRDQRTNEPGNIKMTSKSNQDQKQWCKLTKCSLYDLLLVVCNKASNARILYCTGQIATNRWKRVAKNFRFQIYFSKFLNFILNFDSEENNSQHHPRLRRWAGSIYVVTAKDLRTMDPGNQLVKYTDDRCIVIPASNYHSRTAELRNMGVGK